MEFNITSRENEKIKQLCRLVDEPAARTQTGFFVAESVKLCLDIAAVLPPQQVYYTAAAAEKSPLREALPLLAGEHYLISDPVAEKLSRTKTPQGLWCVFPLPICTPEQLTGSRLVALDRVQDPGNIGAVLRSAAAFGYDGVLLGDGCADAFGTKALRAAMSASVKLPVCRTADLPAALCLLRQKGWHCMAARLENSRELPPVAPETPCVLVIGSEGQGICAQTAEACDESVRIPISSQVESLNAAVAAAILMWHYKN